MTLPNNLSPRVRVLLKDKEYIFSLSELILEGETLGEISDAQLIERTAKWLSKDVSEFSDYRVWRPSTGDLVISTKPMFGREVPMTSEHEMVLNEVRSEYQVSDTILANEVRAEDEVEIDKFNQILRDYQVTGEEKLADALLDMIDGCLGEATLEEYDPDLKWFGYYEGR